VVVFRKCDLTTFAFDRRSQQINYFIVAKYKCAPAQAAGLGNGPYFVIGLSPRPKPSPIGATICRSVTLLYEHHRQKQGTRRRGADKLVSFEI
jgi:hypothetical protein